MRVSVQDYRICRRPNNRPAYLSRLHRTHHRAPLPCSWRPRQQSGRRCCSHDPSTAGRKVRAESSRQPWYSRGLRCALCYDPDFTSLSQLAEHLVGRRHVDLFPSRDSTAACPYCRRVLSRNALYRHIQSGECESAGQLSLPDSQRRRLKQADLEADPRYSQILEDRIPSGLLRIRPMHMQHTFETALAVTEAFVVDLDPPRFGWMLSELRRQAAQYEAHPGLVTRHAVDTDRPTILEAPSVDDVVSENSGRVLDFFPSANDGDKRDRQRRQVEAAWGIWLWLVADLIPDDPSELPEGQDSVIIGATAMMFHDRAAAIEKMQQIEPPITTAALDYSLWLRPYPPAGLDHERAVFVWWTSVVTAFRRQGVAGSLIRGCEAVGAAAGFWSFYIQAALRQRDRDNLLGAWLAREYEAALRAYHKAGYEEYSPDGEPGSLWSRSRRDSKTAALMHKRF